MCKVHKHLCMMAAGRDRGDQQSAAGSIDAAPQPLAAPEVTACRLSPQTVRRQMNYGSCRETTALHLHYSVMLQV